MTQGPSAPLNPLFDPQARKLWREAVAKADAEEAAAEQPWTTEQRAERRKAIMAELAEAA